MSDIAVQIFVFLFAASIGSFLNVCIYRIPIGKSIVSPPSSCPSCSAKLRGFDNIPIVSFIILMGRCRACSAKISFRYPFIEALCALLALLLLARFGLTVDFFVLFLFTCALIVITFIDLDHQIIPDTISLPGIPLGFVASFFILSTSYRDSLIGIVAGGGFLLLIALVYYFITKKEGMGGGDIKLLAMIGAFIGWQGVVFVIFVSSFTGSIVGIAYLLLAGKGARNPIPFGPFLAIAAFVYMILGEEIVSLYLVRIYG